MKYGELNLGQIEAMVNKLGGMEGVQRFLADKLEVVEKNSSPASEIFRLTVDYGQSLEQMIAAGRYDWKNDGITAKRFPVTGEGRVKFEARYFHFDRSISSKDAVEEIKKADTENQWMPAKIEHVLAHGAIFPEEQRKYPIIGLGSVAEVNSDRRVPYLYRSGSDRDLSLGWWVSDWSPGYRFLAVRKVSVP